MKEFDRCIAKINEENNLGISLDTIAQIYGEYVVERMAEMSDEVIANIEYLIFLGFEEDVTDICNRFGIVLCQDTDCFCERVWELVCAVGSNYVEKMGEDMSCWEALM